MPSVAIDVLERNGSRPCLGGTPGTRQRLMHVIKTQSSPDHLRLILVVVGGGNAGRCVGRRHELERPSACGVGDAAGDIAAVARQGPSAIIGRRPG